jgi:hypothetical protein
MISKFRKISRERSFYKAYAIDSSIQKKALKKYSCIDRERKYVYFRIPKSANTTVISSLLSGRPEANIKGIRKKQFDSIGDVEVDEFKCSIKFTLVRSPYTRVLSAFLNKINNGKRAELIRKKLGLEKDAYVSFDAFIEYLEKGGIYEDGHWLPQSCIAPVDIIRDIEILKFENIDEDLPNFLSSKMGIFDLETQANHATGANNKVGEFYTPILAQRVYELYKKDFELFSYKREL